MITPKLHDYELCQAMGVIDEALKDYYARDRAERAML